MLELGYITRLGSGGLIHHHESPRRSYRRMDANGARNKLLFAWLNVPLPHLLAYFPAILANRIAFAISSRRPLNQAVGLAMGFAGIGQYFSRRQPVRRSTYRLFRLLRRVRALELAEVPVWGGMLNERSAGSAIPNRV